MIVIHRENCVKMAVSSCTEEAVRAVGAENGEAFGLQLRDEGLEHVLFFLAQQASIAVVWVETEHS